MPVNQQNLNNETPAAPSGKQNVQWQSDASLPRNDSANVPSTGGAAVKTGSYQIQSSDCGGLLVFEGSENGTFELPADIPFDQWCVYIENNSSPSGSPPVTPILTVTPLSGSPPAGPDLDGSSGSIELEAGEGVYIATDGTAYFTERGMGGGSTLSLETNGTPNADQSLLNLGSTPAAPTGKTNVAWQDDGSGDVSAYMPLMVGDTGSGGTSGAVPAPSAGSAAAGKFLKADGTFAVPGAGSGGGNSMWKLTPPVASDFTQVNFTDATIVSGSNFLSILNATPTAGGGHAIAALHMACPSVPFILWGLLFSSAGAGNGTMPYAGLEVDDGTKLLTVAQGLNNDLFASEYSSVSSYNSTLNNNSGLSYGAAPLWFFISINSSNEVSLGYSYDGVGVVTLVSNTSGYLSANTNIGFFVDAQNGGYPASVTVLSFAFGALAAQ
jgi:hypothetical protein